MNNLLTTIYLSTGWQPYTWFALLVLASLLDALTTIYALRQTGLHEANPVMRWAMEKIGLIPALLVIKLIPLALIFAHLQAQILTVPLWTLGYLGIATWNMVAIYKNKKKSI